MTRVKIWGLTLLALVAAGLTFHLVTQSLADEASERMGSTLRAGVALFEAGTRLGVRQVTDVATLAARDPALRAAAAPAPEDRRGGAARNARPGAAEVLAAGETALRDAARALDVDLGKGAILAVAAEGSVVFRIGDRVGTTREGAADAVLSGTGPRHLRVEDALYVVATVPAGGATLAFGLPVDPRWPERLRTNTGADLTLLSSKPVSSLPPAELATVVNAARKGGGASVEGPRLGGVSLGGVLPGVPILMARAPSFRARAVGAAGMEGPLAVVSVSGRPALEPLAVFQQATLLSMLVLLLVGLVLGLLPERTVTAHVPLELAAAADRIASGDFEARVPRMAGTFGTVAAALSRAADAARAARAQITAPPTPAVPFPVAAPAPRPGPAMTLDVPMTAVPPPLEEPAPRSATPFPAPPPTPFPAPVNDPFLAPVPPAPSPSPVYVAGTRGATASRFEPEPAFPRPAAAPVATPPETGPTLGAPPPPPPAPSAAEADEAQWRSVFQEFLRTRQECGETVEGLTWERFRAKLAKNRDALTQKYACRTVRFQVYVKEGKAALKATPVR
jgi:HAMP domain-containing protein